MTDVIFEFPSRLLRGCVIEARTSVVIDELRDCFEQCWLKVLATIVQLAHEDEDVSILVEIWLDTGRIFWIPKSRRDIFRLELTNIALKQAYFAIMDRSDFEPNYQLIIDTLKAQIESSAPRGRNKSINKYILRDSDMRESEEIVVPE